MFGFRWYDNGTTRGSFGTIRRDLARVRGYGYFKAGVEDVVRGWISTAESLRPGVGHLSAVGGRRWGQYGTIVHYPSNLSRCQSSECTKDKGQSTKKATVNRRRLAGPERHGGRSLQRRVRLARGRA